MQGLLRDEIVTGGNFCRLVVDLAVEVAHYVVMASFSAAKRIGLESITLLHQNLVFTAESACTVAHRGMQQLLEGKVAAMDSSCTIDLSAAAAAEHNSGTLPLHTHAICTADVACFSSLCADGLHLLFSHAGNLLTVSKKLHFQPRGRMHLSFRQLQHHRTPAHLLKPSPAGSNLASASATTDTTSATSLALQDFPSQISPKSSRHLLQSSRAAHFPDMQRTAPMRHLTPGNQVVGGVFLHLTRRTSITSCSPVFSKKLSHACYFDRVGGNATQGTCSWTHCR
jgi:hypothetical protein